jgi:NAD(P)H-nitrite reductase large subunit
MDSNDEVHPVVRGLKTVCRCNNIKYRTIERAIRDGATNLHQVATRTTATTGHCGGSCTPDVQQMIADVRATMGLCTVPEKAERPARESDPDAWWVRK